MASLINLKSDEMGGRIDLTDIENQIHAIQLVHEKLYQSETLTKIDFASYMRELLSTVFGSFYDISVDIQMDAVDIDLDSRTAIPLGLIINEVATNAIKHGFSKEKKNLFSITMKTHSEENRYELTLSNTGKPFPESINLENPDTLGLRLITALTGQLGGKIHLTKKPNPVFRLDFPIHEN